MNRWAIAGRKLQDFSPATFAALSTVVDSLIDGAQKEFIGKVDKHT
jgi:hypothetical protein